MNELMLSAGVIVASATWQWFWQRSVSGRATFDPSLRAGSHEVTFRTREGASTVRVAGKTLLQAALGAQVPLASLCERGVCGTCKVRVCSGAVDVGAARALSEQERTAGYVLACVARPTSAATVDLEPERDG